jgi:peptidoglycan-associated lipoprotein
MTGQRWPAVLLIVLVGAGAACAKRPVMTQASAPAPTGQVAAPPAVPPPAPPSPAPPPPQPPASALAPPATAPTPLPAPLAPATPPPAPTAPSPAPAAVSPPTPPQQFAETPALRDVYFDFDRYTIRADGAKVLDASADWLRSNPNTLVLIEGHCDERGTNEYNLALGERRARATMQYLVTKGVAVERITILSYGEERPACTAHQEACWAKNRRAHFLTKAR